MRRYVEKIVSGNSEHNRNNITHIRAHQMHYDMCPEVQANDYHVSVFENHVEKASDEKLRDGNFLQILAATARRHTGRPLVNCDVRPGLTRGVVNRL